VDEENINLLNIPVKNDNILIEKIRDSKTGQMEAIIILPDKGEVKVINEVGLIVLELIDGKNSLRNIINRIQSLYDASMDDIERDVTNFIIALNSKGIIRF